ncbi:MAG: di-trans,poly-cis-decaprenylcistransferase [Dehalococcoidia bacterium]|nr:MAG: di-trans,poly-cis-decaprenylcistransferase [Dehalococcoidia bacterium]
MAKITVLPKHVAIIMDGNGRWAKQRHLPRLKGHEEGVENIVSVVECLGEYGVRYVTLYGFSTENWNRPRSEVRGLLKLLRETIDKKVSQFHKRGVKLYHLGRLEGLSQDIKSAINRALELTKNNDKMTLSFALNYGGRVEILDAIRRLIAEGVPPQKIDEGLFRRYLYTTDLPDVDLVIRTGGELRTSNFLVWQAAYSEYYFTPVLWPDFDEKEVEKALLSYSQRQRRFGGLGSERQNGG